MLLPAAGPDCYFRMRMSGSASFQEPTQVQQPFMAARAEDNQIQIVIRALLAAQVL